MPFRELKAEQVQVVLGLYLIPIMGIMMKPKEKNNYLEKSKIVRQLKRDKPNTHSLQKSKRKKFNDDDWSEY
jgi:predicted nucleic acid-binding protein